MDMVVDQGCQEVVCGCYRVEVTVEVQVDIFHRDDLRVTAASGTPLHTKAGAE